MSSKYRILLIMILALLVYVSQISVQGMSPREVTPDQDELTRSAALESTGGVQNLDMSNTVLSFTQQASTCPGDFDGNGIVNIADFLLFTGVFGASSGDANYNALMDMDGNGEIGIPDFLLFVDVFDTTCKAPPPSLTSDRDVLVILYNATGGPNWKNNTNWLTDAPLGDWYGVEVDDAGRVVRLNLSGRWNNEAREWTTNNLRGSIPAEIGQLSRLTYLNLGYNLLTGLIPPEIGDLGNLEFLSLHQNNLVGEIPPEIGNLIQLRTLLLGTSNFEAINQLTGSIPSELGNLTNLRTLNLRYNDLTGVIPSELGQLANLEDLDLGGNRKLGGPIPPEIGNLTNLRNWANHQTSLHGPIPPEIGKLERLVSLDLSNNNLSGPIPRSLLDLAHLDRFFFDANGGLCAPGIASFATWLAEIDLGRRSLERLYCSEPDVAVLESLFESTNGQNWTNSDGWLGGPILENWHGVRVDTLGLVTALDLSENGLSGTLPASLGELGQLTELRLGGNPSLSGLIPLSLSLGRLPVNALHYTSTSLCAPADPSFREWVNTIASHEGTGKECAVTPDREILRALYEATGGPNWTNNANWLTDAPLGTWHGIVVDEEDRVIELNLSRNNLMGTIPSQLGYLAQLRSLSLSLNRLVGPIPGALGYLTHLEGLWLNNNYLTGSIPPELGNLASLQHLSIHGNQDIKGFIPPELGNLSALENLWAGRCQMGGLIPAELGNLTNLRTLAIFGARLLGSIPPELGNLANLRKLWLSDNLLSGSIPPELGDLRALVELDLARNALSNSLPSELSRLSNLETLKLGMNDLSGPIPAEFGELASLQSLYVNVNAAMTGPLPASLSTLQSLETLQTTGTDLCAPQALLEWLEGVPSQIVARCDAQFSGAYLSQAVQSSRFSVPLVAGEEALLRVFATAARANNEDIPNMRASFFQEGTLTHIADIPSKPGPVPTTLDEGSLAKSANAVIPGELVQPELEMIIEIDPDGTLDPGLGVTRRIPETGRWRIDVRAMPVFDLTMIPLIWTLAPDSSAMTAVAEMAADPKNHEMLWATRTLLPVGDIKVTAHEPVVNSDTTNLQMIGVRIAQAIRAMEGGTGHYMTILSLPNNSNPGGRAEVGGRVSFAGLQAETIAHELGHNMNLRHAPCGSAAGIDPAYPNIDGTIGAWGYDFRDGGRLLPPHAYDLMGYCRHPTWIGNYHFDKALRFRLADEDASKATATPTTSLLLWGGKDAEENPYLEPAFVVNAPPALPQSGGQYRLTGRNAIRTELFSLTFDMPYVAHGNGMSNFAFVLPVDPEWKDKLTSITLTGPGGSFTLDSNTDSPMTILRNPKTGQIRGFLRDLPKAALARSKIAVDALSSEPGLEALFSRGIPGVETYQQ